MRNLFALALALVAPLSFGAPQTRVSYDSHSFKIDGKNTFIYSGAFHYFRCPKELWPARLQAIKDAGFNAIETYTAWNVHETRPPTSASDFSHVDVKELDEFLSLAIDQYGFNVVIRPGPYICSEWNMGGYPSWLLLKKPEKPTRYPWLRSDDPTFLTWARHWFKAVDPVIAKHQITKTKPGGKGVILYQIENEYDYAGGSDQVHLNQLHALAEQALADGIDVPLISCWTHQIRTTTDPILKSVVDCPNFYPRWDVEGTRGSIEAARNQQPGKPVMITELQGGWFSEVGGLLAEDQSGITAAQERNLTLYCIQNGVTATNYYMLFGGTNFGDWTPPNITTSYDYFAPIREDGSGGAKYREVQAIGNLLAAHGSEIATSSPDSVPSSTDHTEVQLAVRKAENGTRFVFLRNASHSRSFTGAASLGGDSFNYSLEPFGSTVIVVKPGQKIQAAEWWGPVGENTVVDLGKGQRQRITQAFVRADNGAASSKPAVFGDVVRNGVYDNRYVVYRAKIAAVPSDSKLLLGLASAGNGVLRLNGKELPVSGHRHGQPLYSLPSDAPANSQLEFLYENPGRPNGDVAMEFEHGLASGKILKNLTGDKTFDTWKIHNAPLAVAQTMVNSDVDEKNWQTVTLHSGDRQDQLNGYGTVAVFRTSFEIDQATIDSGLTHLEFGGIDDEGWVYVNGTKVGETHDWTVPVTADVRFQLHAGKNVIAVVVRNFGGTGGLYEPPILTGNDSEGMSLNWTISDLQGVSGHWQDSATSGKGWQQITLNSTGVVPRKVRSGSAKPVDGDSPTTALANWFGFSFNAPSTTGTVALRIDALGNGFVWLNGHPLGRYWQVGPQREYFVPANWLKPQANEVKLLLRPVDGYATLRGAEVAPWGRE